MAEAKPLTQVHAAVAVQQDYSNTVTLTGEVVAQHSINLSFRTNGQIADILVKVGEHVEAGTILARLDSQLQEADLIAAQASLQSAQSQLILAKSEFDRKAELLENGFTTRMVYEQFEAALSLAQGAAALAQVQLELAQSALDLTTMTAPRSGIVIVSFTEEGQVSPVAQPVFTFAVNGARDAVFQVHETALYQNMADAPIALSYTALPNQSGECRVREISPVVHPQTGTVQVKCGIVNPPPNLTLGSVLRGTAMLPSMPLIVLPWAAMASLNGEPAVWVYNETTRTVGIRAIDVERYEVGRILVGAGIEDGEVVITEGARFMREGLEVLIIGGGAE